jgi:hypothetical protein
MPGAEFIVQVFFERPIWRGISKPPRDWIDCIFLKKISLFARATSAYTFAAG